VCYRHRCFILMITIAILVLVVVVVVAVVVAGGRGFQYIVSVSLRVRSRPCALLLLRLVVLELIRAKGSSRKRSKSTKSQNMFYPNIRFALNQREPGIARSRRSRPTRDVRLQALCGWSSSPIFQRAFTPPFAVWRWFRHNETKKSFLTS